LKQFTVAENFVFGLPLVEPLPSYHAALFFISPISTGMALKSGIPVVASSSDVNGSGYGKKESQRTDLTILYVCPAIRSSNGRRKGLAKACPLRGVRMRFLRHRIYEISAVGSKTKAAHEVVAAHSPLTTLAKARRASSYLQSKSSCERL
jgi:hypothetical protein